MMRRHVRGTGLPSKLTQEDDKDDLYNLTEGLYELDGQEPGVRRFGIGFMSESVLEGHCRDFSITKVSV